MSQLALSIQVRTPYFPENFILHVGVEKIYSSLLDGMQSQRFLPFFLHGQGRSGKTHLLVKLSAGLRGLGRYPRLFDGCEFYTWMQTLTSETVVDADEVILVDNFQKILSNKERSFSPGLFVQTIELLRRYRIPLVFTSSESSEGFCIDEHVGSRIREMTHFDIEAPSREELPRLLLAMAKQRGLRLSSRKLQFLEKRLPLNIVDIEQYLYRLAQLLKIRGGVVDFPLLEDAL